ncbi:MAG: condensation domain-containing protein, partial [Chloroflexota bacterium]
TRPLGLLERLFTRLDQVQPMNVVAIVRVRGGLDPVALQDAAQRVQARHPLLRVRLDHPAETPGFTTSDVGPIPVRPATDGAWPAAAERELTCRFPEHGCPLIRLAVRHRPEHPEHSDLLITFHHAIGDALSAVCFVRDLFTALTSPVPLAALPVRPVYEALLATRLQDRWPEPILEHPEHKPAPPAPDAISCPGGGVPHPNPLPTGEGVRPGNVRHNWAHSPQPPVWRPRVVSYALDAGATRALVDRCHAQQASVHGALCAALLLAHGPRPIELTCPVNLRPLLSGREHDLAEDFGLFVADTAWFHRLDGRSHPWDFWDLAGRIAHDVRGLATSDEVLRAQLARLQRLAPLLDGLGSPDARSPAGPLAGSIVGVTNLGRVPLARRFGEWEIESFQFVVTPPTPMTLLAAASLDDHLTLNLIYPEPFVSQTEAQQIMDSIRGRLDETGAQGAAPRLRQTVAGLSPSRQELLQRLLERRAETAQDVTQEATHEAAREAAPLSYGQRAMWFLHRMAPDSPAYIQPFAAWLRGRVEPARLQAAFVALQQRHDVLRAVFPEEAGEPRQRVLARPELPWQHVDASAWSDDEWQRRLRQCYTTPFDLERELGWRVCLFSRSAEEHFLFLAMHHIISDFWSLMILADELRACYDGEPLPPQRAQYADFVRWQESFLAGERGSAAREYWLAQLSAGTPALSLPVDRPYPATPTLRGQEVAFTWTEERSAQVRAFARAQGVTLFTALLAVYQVLLHRLSGQESFLVGSPVAGRSRAEFRGVVGDLINTVALRAELGGDPTFQEYLQGLQRRVAGALTHQDYPFPLLVEQLQPGRDPG